MSFPDTEVYIYELWKLHLASSRLQSRPILPKDTFRALVDWLKLAQFGTYKQYLAASLQAVNGFRDHLPVSEKSHSLFQQIQNVDLTPAYKAFGQPFRNNNKENYPPYYLDFSDSEPKFYEDEPNDKNERVRWRNDRRYFQDFELAEWKGQKRAYEKRQKENSRKLSPIEEALLGTPFYPHWQNFPETYGHPVPFVIPPHLRFGHQFLVGASRSGKTTFLTAQLLEDLKRVEHGECSVIVMDSQNEFVPNISKLALFGKGQPLEGKLIYLEPAKYPIASNIFSGDFRSNFDNAEFFLNSIFKSDVSSQQITMLKYAVQALTVIPRATVSTLKELMEDGGYAKFQHHFNHLDPVVHGWIKDRLYSKDFSVTRVAIRNRLDGFLADSFFRAMFADAESKLDLFEELKTPKVILVNTADLGGALEPFGRFFIAKLDEAMLKRKNTPKRLPVFCYIDEASDYISDEPLIAKIIDKLGKQKLGMIISIQRKAQISSPTVLDALQHVPIQAWTIKPPTVMISVGQEPVEIRVPLIELDKQPRMMAAEYEALRLEMKRRYGSVSTQKEPPTVSPKTQTTKPSSPDSDETDAKPW